MPNWIREPLDGGQVDSRERTGLLSGELQQSTGGWYKPNDRRLWKQGGRSAFGDTGSGEKVKGVYLAGFDEGGDLLLAYSGTTIYNSDAVPSGSFANLITGLNSSGTKLCGAHYNDRHYLCNGYDTNRVVETDGSSRVMGMESPGPFTTAANSVQGSATRPAEPSGDATDPAYTMDALLRTSGYMSLSAAGSQTDTWSGGGWTGAAYGADQTLVVTWNLSGMPIDPSAPPRSTYIDDTGGGIDAGYDVTVKIEIDTDGDLIYDTTILELTTSGIAWGVQTKYTIASGVDPDDISVKITLTYNNGSKTAKLLIYDVRIQDNPTGSAITTDTGVYYAITEYDSTRGLESPPTYGNAIVELTAKYGVTLTLPTKVNSHATHFKVYRTTDGGTSPNGLGRVGESLATDTVFVDDFQDDKDTQTYPLLEMLAISVGQASDPSDTLLIPKDTSPPSLRRIRSFKGFLVGLTRTNFRELRYCVPGSPESWPEIYVITSFPLEEHDSLVDLLEVGNTLLIAGKGAMLRTDDLPRIVGGAFNAAEISKIQGAPGCVSEYGLCSVSVAGEAHAAWISDYGVYITNGVTYTRISDDIGGTWEDIKDFDKSGWVLHWDKRRTVLILAYSSTDGGENDRYVFLHMAPDHRKQDGQPKATGPHYGEYAALASGQVANAHRVYSAHPDDGYVYLEDSGTTDAALSYNASGTWPLIVKTRRLHGGEQEFSTLKARLRHSDFGSSQTCTVAWLTGRDSSGNEQTRSQSVSLSGQKATLFDVARGGEYHEVTITHTGAATGALVDLQIEARPLGGSGKVSVA